MTRLFHLRLPSFAFRLSSAALLTLAPPAIAALLVDQGERWAKLYEEIIVKGQR